MSKQGYSIELQTLWVLVFDPVLPQTDLSKQRRSREVLFLSCSARREKPVGVGSIPQIHSICLADMRDVIGNGSHAFDAPCLQNDWPRRDGNLFVS
jgi:hypothetical protein